MSLAYPPSTLSANPSLLTLRQGLGLVRFYDPSRGNWDAHRFYGPLFDMRFDHHEPPCGVHPVRSVWYAASSLRGAVSEAFGRTGILDRSSGVRIVKAEVVGQILVLDLLGVASRAVGLTQEIAATTEYRACQTWARAFYEQYSDIQGIRWRGRQVGSICVLLNDRASMSDLSADDFALTDPEIWPRVARAARDCAIKVI